MSKRKICVVITARPSYSRIQTALRSIKRHPDLTLQLVVAGSALLDRYGNALTYIKKDGFEVSAKVHTVVEGDSLTTMVKTTGLSLLEIPAVFERLGPDMVVTIADRYETVATAIAAAYMNITLVHVQGGEITGSIDDKVRHAVTKLSDYHFVATSAAGDRVMRMGEGPSRVFVTGCPSIDLASCVGESSSLPFDPLLKYGGVGDSIDLSAGYVVVLQHPVTTEHEAARVQIEETLHGVHEVGRQALWFWPNVDAGSDGTSEGIRAFRERVRPQNMHFFKNMEGHDFLLLLHHSRCLVGNSSVGIRECAFLGVPVVNVGSRQAGRERGDNVLDASCDRNAIKAAILTQTDRAHFRPSTLYGDGRAGQRIADLLASLPCIHDKRLAWTP